MSWRAHAPRESGHGEYGGLLIFSVLGMGVFVSAQNLVTLFLGIELLSIPLYILCASETRREASLESGLKYLIVGSVGSATLVYGLALVYGATGSTDFAGIGTALSQSKLAGGALGSPMVYTGLGLTIVGFAFKASVAPFHQWTPDVYEGAPTPITAFMATATKAAALGAFLRFFDVAAIGAQDTWAPLLATVAAITIIVGNAGALGQSSLKRMHGLLGRRPGRIHARRRDRRHPARSPGDRALPDLLPVHEHGGVRGDRRRGARAARRRRPERPGRAGRAPAVAGLADDDRHARPGRDPWHGRLHRQVPADPRPRRRATTPGWPSCS